MKRVLFLLLLAVSPALADKYDDDVKAIHTLQNVLDEERRQEETNWKRAEQRYQDERTPSNTDILPGLIFLAIIILFVAQHISQNRVKNYIISPNLPPETFEEWHARNPTYDPHAPSPRELAAMEQKANQKPVFSEREKTFYIVAGAMTFVVVVLALMIRH